MFLVSHKHSMKRQMGPKLLTSKLSCISHCVSSCCSFTLTVPSKVSPRKNPLKQQSKLLAHQLALRFHCTLTYEKHIIIILKQVQSVKLYFRQKQYSQTEMKQMQLIWKKAFSTVYWPTVQLLTIEYAMPVTLFTLDQTSGVNS